MIEIDIIAAALPEAGADMEMKKSNAEEPAKESIDPSYHVTIKQGIIKEIPLFMKMLFSRGKVAIVSDENVSALYSNDMKKSLAEAGFDAYLWSFPSGDESKNMKTLADLMEFMSRNAFARSDLMLSVGGGVVRDIAGLAASLYECGMRFVHVPTDLLSACDSCIGGRNRISLSGGRNCCESIYFPTAVYIDPDVIRKAGGAVLGNGMVEVIRAALIGGKDFFESIEQEGVEDRLEDVISRCLVIKNGYVGKKGSEYNERRILSFGKIFSRAVDQVSGFSLGYAKSLGTGLALTIRAAVAKGYSDRTILDRTVALLRRYDLISEEGFSFSDIKSAILKENKIGKGCLNFVVPYTIGDCRLVKVDLKDMDDWIRDAVEFESEQAMADASVKLDASDASCAV